METSFGTTGEKGRVKNHGGDIVGTMREDDFFKNPGVNIGGDNGNTTRENGPLKTLNPANCLGEEDACKFVDDTFDVHQNRSR